MHLGLQLFWVQLWAAEGIMAWLFAVAAALDCHQVPVDRRAVFGNPDI